MVPPGADVKEGQPVMALETDKAVIEVPSSVSGVVQEIRVKEGDKLKVGQVIFTVENGAGAKARAEGPAKEAPAPLAQVESKKTVAPQVAQEPGAAVPARAQASAPAADRRPPVAPAG